MSLEGQRVVSSGQHTEGWKDKLEKALSSVRRSDIPQAPKVVVQRMSMED